MAEPTRQEDLAPEVARWLVNHGAEDVSRVVSELDLGRSELDVAQALRDAGLSPPQGGAVLGAARSRRRARSRWLAAERLWFTPTALEQASDPAVSAWRSLRFAGAHVVVDAGCGAGADLMALAGRADTTVGLDRDVGRLHLAAANLGATGTHAGLVAADATTWCVAATALHADPARRRAGRRVRDLADTEPGVDALLRAPVDAKGIVVGPAVALTDPVLPSDVEIEFVQVGNDLVEAVLWQGDLRRPGAVATATILADDGPVDVGQARMVATLAREVGSLADDGVDRGVAAVGDTLLDPAPALVRARLHEQLAEEHGAWRISPHAAVLSAGDAPPAGPWWRAYAVEAVLPARPRAVRRWLASADPAPLEIRLHGPGLSVDPWWRGLGAVERGPGGRRLHVVRLADGAVAIATRGIPTDRPGTSQP